MNKWANIVLRGVVAFIMIVTFAIIITAYPTYRLYEDRINDKRNQLIEMLNHEVKDIENIYSLTTNKDYIINYYQHVNRVYQIIGNTADFVIGILSNGNYYLNISSKDSNYVSRPMPAITNNTGPMRIALQKHSGTVITKDYRNIEVLAAYHYFDLLDWGLVLKIDMEEVIKPLQLIYFSNLFIVIIVVTVIGFIYLYFKEKLNQSNKIKADITHKYSKLLENSSSIVLIMDNKGFLKYMNRYGLQFFGYTEDEVIGKNVVGTIVPYTDTIGRDLEEMILDIGQQPDNYKINENENITKDGKKVWILWSNRAFYDQNGSMIEIVCVGNDLTAKKESERELVELNHLIVNMLDSISDAFFSLDENLCFTYFNNEAERILKKSSNEVLNQYIFDVFPEAKGSLFETNYKKANEEKIPISFEVNFLVEPYSNWYEVRVYPQEMGITVYFQVITERKIAEERIRESEELFRTYFNNSPIGIIVVDKEGKYIQVNPTSSKLTGYSEEELLHMKIGDLTAPESNETIKNHFKEVIEKGRADCEIAYKTKNGEIRYSELYAVKISDNKYMAYRVDITERKQMEKEILRNNRMLDSLWTLSALQDVNIKIINDFLLKTMVEMTESQYGFYGFINEDESVMTIYSWSGEAMKGCSMVDKPSQYPIKDSGIWAEAVRHRKPFIFNNYSESHPSKKGLPTGHVQIKRLLVIPHFVNGKIKAVAAVANRNYDYKNEDAKHINIFLDSIQILIDKLLLNESLKESELRYRQLFENMTTGFALHEIIYDEFGKPTDYRFLEVNPAFEKMTGLSSSQVIGKTVKEVMPKTEEYWIQNYGKVAMTGVPIEYENFSAEIGNYFYVYAFCPEKNRFAVIFNDITDKKLAEAKITDLNQNLEKRIKDALDEIRQKDLLLIQQSRLAALGELLQNIAHQWRQPLTSISLIVQNIFETYNYNRLTQEIMKNKKDKIVDLIEYLSKTIDVFRDFFKENKNEVIFKINDVITNAVNIVSSTFHSNNISLNVIITNDVKITGNPNELAQVIINILINAKEVIIERKVLNPQVIISVDINNNNPTISIEDNAGGIDTKILDKIFDPYFTTKESGTGIGLYMSKMIVEKSFKGSIKAKNGKAGAVFEIILGV